MCPRRRSAARSISFIYLLDDVIKHLETAVTCMHFRRCISSSWQHSMQPLARITRLSLLRSFRIPFSHVRHSLLSPYRPATKAATIQRRGMKRTATSKPAQAKARAKLPDYCDVEPRRDEAGNPIWPAPAEAIEAARAFIKEW